MENKIKALFFAQYLGQEVGYGIDHLMVNELTVKSNAAGKLALGSIDHNCALLLRDIGQLTDEEITAIGCSVGWGVSEENKGTVLPWVRNDLKNNLHKYGIYKDILRLYGVLIDFTYLNEENKPVTLTPADIVSRGWCKLKTT